MELLWLHDQRRFRSAFVLIKYGQFNLICRPKIIWHLFYLPPGVKRDTADKYPQNLRSVYILTVSTRWTSWQMSLLWDEKESPSFKLCLFSHAKCTTSASRLENEHRVWRNCKKIPAHDLIDKVMVILCGAWVKKTNKQKNPSKTL